MSSVKTTDVESHPTLANQLKYTAPDVTFDEELLCAIEIYIRHSVHELRRWAVLKVNTEGLVLKTQNVCYEN